MNQNNSDQQNLIYNYRDVANPVIQQDLFQVSHQENHLISESNEEPQYQLDQLHQIMKDILFIIESNTLNEEEKKMKLKEMYNELKKKQDINELRKIFNIEAFKLILKYLNDFTTTIQKLLFNIIDLVAEKGIQKPNPWNHDHDPIFINIQQSGLLMKIEQLMQQKIEQEEKENDNIPFSQITEQLLRIYLNIMKEEQIDDEMKEQIIKIIDKSISNIFGSSLLSEQEKEQKALILFEEIMNNDINELIKIFDIWKINIMKIRIGNCSSQSEKIILNIIEIISEKGKQEDDNIFFFTFHYSGFISKIEQLIQQKIEQEQEENDNIPFSQTTEQLTRIYLNIMQGKQIEYEMKERIIQIMDKSISNILGSYLISEQEKESKAIIVFEEMKNQDINELVNIYDDYMIQIMVKRIGNCSSESEKIILKIIELLAEKGKQMHFDDGSEEEEEEQIEEGSNEYNQFLNDFQKFGLITKIQQLIQQKIEQDEKENDSIPFSDITELVKIYLNIVKEEQIEEEMKERIIKIIDKSTSNIFGSNLLSEQEKEQKALIQFEEIMNKDVYELMNIFDIWKINLMKIRIGNCSSESEQNILNVIELLIEKGNQQYNNKLFNIFQYSGLLVKIEQLIQQKIEQEEKEKYNIPFSYITEQLMQIYLNIMNGKQIKDEMKERIIKILDKSTSNIFGSNLLSEQEKEQKAITLFEEMKNKNINEQILIFDIWNINIMKLRIGNCSSESEKTILNIIEYLSEKGNYQEYNQFFNDFQYFGLISKIKLIIEDKIDKEKDQKKYSEETEQLTRILIQIMKGRENDQSMIDIYDKVINKNINNILNIINIIKQDNKQEINNQMNKQETESELQQTSELIKIISLIRVNYFGERIPDQIINILKEKIFPLIHLNCPEDINCTQRIIIQSSPALQKLKEVAIQALVEVYNNNSEFKFMLKYDNNFILHLAQLIISYSAQFQLEQKTNISQQQHHQQSEYSSSPSFISSSLQFLSSLILNNNEWKQSIKIHNLLHSLSVLTNYQHNIYINNEQDYQSQQIRYWSRQCLGTIQSNGDKQDQSELINVGYGRVLIICISTAGGTEMQGDQEIINGLQNIYNFLRELNNGRNNYNYNKPSFPAQPALAKSCIEQIEDEGGNEELETQLINKWNDDQFVNNIKYQANKTKAEILNTFINSRNTWQQYYW